MLKYSNTHYYEVDDVWRVDSRRLRVRGMYAPLDDRDELKRRFDVVVPTRRVDATGAEIEAARLEAESDAREAAMGWDRYEDAYAD